MTELQKCEFKLLKKIIKIINDNNLKYFLVCGSALGAVKYGGFIPWDDDVDIALPRKDYNILIDSLERCVDDEFILQNFRTDSNVPFVYSKVRMKNTTFIERTAIELDINHGVYIDVFPLDNCPETFIKSIFFEIKKQVLFRTLSSVFYRQALLKRIVMFPVKMFALQKLNAIVTCYDKHLRKVDSCSSGYWCNYGNSPSKKEYAPKSQYGNGTMMKFEGLDVRVPEKYDEYLTQKYGDWRADLPDEQKKGHHYYVVCDLERPYTEYFERTRKGKLKLKKL